MAIKTPPVFAIMIEYIRNIFMPFQLSSDGIRFTECMAIIAGENTIGERRGSYGYFLMFSTACGPGVFKFSFTQLVDFTGIIATCLLYTSDAADEEDSVDLGGRRIL